MDSECKCCIIEVNKNDMTKTRIDSVLSTQHFDACCIWVDAVLTRWGTAAVAAAAAYDTTIFKTVFDRNKVFTMHVSLTFESVYDSEYEAVKNEENLVFCTLNN